MTDPRYGFYLRPSYAMCRAQAEMHELLRRQYGLRAAGVFMPHATIKGFFRTDAPVAELAARLDAVLAGRRPFPVHNGGVVRFGDAGIGLTIQRMPDGAVNVPLQALHDAALAALLPLVRPDCDFTPNEWAGPRFEAHLTLAMADIPLRFFDEIERFVRAAEPIGPPGFEADTLQLFAFTSDDWTGRYWEILGWELLRSWRLARPPGPAPEFAAEAALECNGGTRRAPRRDQGGAPSRGS